MDSGWLWFSQRLFNSASVFKHQWRSGSSWNHLNNYRGDINQVFGPVFTKAWGMVLYREPSSVIRNTGLQPVWIVHGRRGYWGQRMWIHHVRPLYPKPKTRKIVFYLSQVKRWDVQQYFQFLFSSTKRTRRTHGRISLGRTKYLLLQDAIQKQLDISFLLSAFINSDLSATSIPLQSWSKQFLPCKGELVEDGVKWLLARSLWSHIRKYVPCWGRRNLNSSSPVD